MKRKEFVDFVYELILESTLNNNKEVLLKEGFLDNWKASRKQKKDQINAAKQKERVEQEIREKKQNLVQHLDNAYLKIWNIVHNMDQKQIRSFKDLYDEENPGWYNKISSLNEIAAIGKDIEQRLLRDVNFEDFFEQKGFSVQLPDGIEDVEDLIKAFCDATGAEIEKVRHSLLFDREYRDIFIHGGAARWIIYKSKERAKRAAKNQTFVAQNKEHVKGASEEPEETTDEEPQLSEERQEFIQEVLELFDGYVKDHAGDTKFNVDSRAFYDAMLSQKLMIKDLKLKRDSTLNEALKDEEEQDVLSDLWDSDTDPDAPFNPDEEVELDATEDTSEATDVSLDVNLNAIYKKHEVAWNMRQVFESLLKKNASISNQQIWIVTKALEKAIKKTFGIERSKIASSEEIEAQKNKKKATKNDDSPPTTTEPIAPSVPEKK